MNVILRFRLLAVLGLVVLSGCAHAPRNAPLAHWDKNAGYRFGTLPTGTNSDELFVVLAFSGGGTRASAFSFGALEELAKTPIQWQGVEKRLLDEVDIISSVSGGSFTSAYYGLYRDRALRDFPDQFLYKNVTMALALRLLSPFNWFRLASPEFSRIDMAAEYYDDHVFNHKTFQDLRAVDARPLILLNATDMSLVQRFEFTQDQFDVLGSDLSNYPVARGVAASSAFPFLLCPLTIYNHPPPPNYQRPGWLRDALSNRQDAPREFAFATAVNSYLETTNRPYIHLMDGGLADNIGLRGPAFAMTSVQNLWNIKNLLSTKIKYMLVITVNAKPEGAQDWDKSAKPPGILGMFSVVSSGPMGNYSDETIQYLKDTFDTWNQEVEVSRQWAIKNNTPVPALHAVKYYHVELSFQDVKDPVKRAALNAMPTTFNLPRKDIDLLRSAAAELIRDSETLKQLREDLKNP
jgi:NTE family protein